MTEAAALAALAVVLLLVLVLSWSASRLDHLHSRCERGAATLDAELLRRASAALELAASGMLDPASALVLADEAQAARSAGPAEREAAESALTQALFVVFEAGDDGSTVVDGATSPAERQVVLDLARSCRRVELARRLYNESVRVTRVRRRSRVVRYLRLAGTAAMPQTSEFDDRVPAALADLT
jgi:hypothetical protein